MLDLQNFFIFSPLWRWI